MNTIPRELQTKTTAIAKTANEHKITNKTDYDRGTNLLLDIRKVYKTIKSRKEDITKPLNTALKSARDLFKPLETTLKSAEDNLKGEVITYQEILKQEAIAKRQELLKNVDPTVEDPELQTKLAELDKGDVDGLSTRTTKEVIITDASIVPKKYWVIDMVALRADVRKLKAYKNESIPGVEVQIRKGLAIRVK